MKKVFQSHNLMTNTSHGYFMLSWIRTGLSFLSNVSHKNGLIFQLAATLILVWNVCQSFISVCVVWELRTAK